MLFKKKSKKQEEKVEEKVIPVVNTSISVSRKPKLYNTEMEKPQIPSMVTDEELAEGMVDRGTYLTSGLVPSVVYIDKDDNGKVFGIPMMQYNHSVIKPFDMQCIPQNIVFANMGEALQIIQKYVNLCSNNGQSSSFYITNDIRGAINSTFNNRLRKSILDSIVYTLSEIKSNMIRLVENNHRDYEDTLDIRHMSFSNMNYNRLTFSSYRLFELYQDINNLIVSKEISDPKQIESIIEIFVSQIVSDFTLDLYNQLSSYLLNDRCISSINTTNVTVIINDLLDCCEGCILNMHNSLCDMAFVYFSEYIVLHSNILQYLDDSFKYINQNRINTNYYTHEICDDIDF